MEVIIINADKIQQLKKLQTKGMVEYIKLVVKATNLEEDDIIDFILDSKLHTYNIPRLIIKIHESNFLLGKTFKKPVLNNFICDRCLHFILSDFYINKGLKTIETTPIKQVSPEINNIVTRAFKAFNTNKQF